VRGHREVADDPRRPFVDQHVGPRALPGRVARGSPEPVVEVGVPAIERFEIVIVAKRLDPIRHRMRRR